MSSKGTRKFIDIDDLEAGDIVEFVRAGGMYRHCGVYDGNYGVIHRAAEPGAGSRVALDARGIFAKLGIESDKAEIRRDELRKVAGSSAVYRTNIYDSVIRPFPRKEILRRAEERLGEKGYNIIYKNCQHFCTGTRYGTAMIMEIEVNTGLRTGYSYRDSRVLVNIVKLLNMPVQSFPYHPERKMILPYGKFNHPYLKENVNMTEKSLLDQVRAASKESVALAMKISADVVVGWNRSQYNTTSQRSKFPWTNTKFGNERITTITQKSRCIGDNCRLDLQDLVKDVDIDRCYKSPPIVIQLSDTRAGFKDLSLDFDNDKCSTHSTNHTHNNNILGEICSVSETNMFSCTHNITATSDICCISKTQTEPDIRLCTRNSGRDRLPDYLEYKYEPLNMFNRDYLHFVANMFDSSEQVILLDKNNTRNDTLSCMPTVTFSDISCAVANPATTDMLWETGNSFSTGLFNNNFANSTFSATGSYNCIEGGGCVIL